MAARPGALWLRWIAAGAAGGGLAAPLCRPLALALGEPVRALLGQAAGEAVVGAVALGGMVGAMTLAQGLAVRKEVPWAGRWAATGLVAGVLSGVLGLGLYGALASWGHPAPGALIGAGLGLLSFATIHHGALGRVVTPWVGPISLMGLVGATVGTVCVGGMPILDGIAYGIGYGVVTGGALFMLRGRTT